MKLTDNNIREIMKHLEAGEPLPEKWRGRLFPLNSRAEEVEKKAHKGGGAGDGKKSHKMRKPK